MQYHMAAMRALLTIAMSWCVVSCGALLANETELLAVTSVQAGASMTAFKNEIFEIVAKSNRFRSVPGLFQQQEEVYHGSYKNYLVLSLKKNLIRKTTLFML
jgi:hypothetical protein